MTENNKNSNKNSNKSAGLQGFLCFVREQGVVGLAVGFILGGSISKMVSSFVNDIVNPLLSIILGSTENLKNAYVGVGGVQIRYGSFFAVVIDFVIVALVVYFGVKGLGLDRLDKKK